MDLRSLIIFAAMAILNAAISTAGDNEDGDTIHLNSKSKIQGCHILIHSANPESRPVIDPLGQPTATAGRDNCFHTCCPSVRPSSLFQSSKTKQQQKKMFATGVTVGSEWIIDDICLVYFHTCRPSVPNFQNCTKQNNFQERIYSDPTGGIVGLTEGSFMTIGLL